MAAAIAMARALANLDDSMQRHGHVVLLSIAVAIAVVDCYH
jgi:hypothetical protein